MNEQRYDHPDLGDQRRMRSQALSFPLKGRGYEAKVVHVLLKTKKTFMPMLIVLIDGRYYIIYQ